MELPSEEFIADAIVAYKEVDEVAEPTSLKAVEQLIASSPKEDNAKAAKIYFSKKLGDYQLRVVDALRNIAYDLAYDTPEMKANAVFSVEESRAVVRETGLPPMVESSAELAFYKGMNGENAKKAAQWVYANLDEVADAKLAGLVADYIDAKLYTESEQFNRMMAKNSIGIAEKVRGDSTIEEYKKGEAELGVTIEGVSARVDERATKLLSNPDTLGKLNKEEVSTLEQHYKAKSDSIKFAANLRKDLLAYLSKGVKAVASEIRSIITKLAALVLAISIGFNQVNFDAQAKAMQMPMPTTPAQLMQVVEKPRADFGAIMPTVTAAWVADRVVGNKDAQGKPFIIVDKPAATAYVFDGDGKIIAASPILIGAARGDVLPQSAINKTVDQTLQSEKVTPAGRFGARVEVDAAYGTSLRFLDLPGSYLAMHKTYLDTPSERRQQRLDTVSPEDNRISYGCINVDAKFYKNIIEKNFGKTGGTMYITPDVQTLEQTFQSFANYSPTETIVTSIITNPASVTDVQQHSDLGVFRTAQTRSRQSKVRTPNKPPAIGPNELALNVSLASPLHPAVISALSDGNFAQAMRLMAVGKDPRTAKLALRLLQAAVNPNVEIVDNLTDEAGKPVAGLFDPTTNTIRLDSERGMTAHTLIHETGHSALSHVLDKASHPVTQQMQKLFNDVKGLLDTAYGATNLQEFAAEAMANNEFRAKLNGINPNGGKVTAWQRFQNIVGNFFRGLFGLPTKPISETTLDKVDQLIDSILSPAPESRDGGLLYAAAINPKATASRMFESFAKMTEGLPLMSQERADILHDFVVNASSDAVRSAFLGALPLNLLSEVAEKHVPGASNVDRLQKLRSGKIMSRNEKIEPLVTQAQNWVKGHKNLEETFNKVVYFSTINKVDPTKTETDYAAKPKKDGTISADAKEAAAKDIENLREVKRLYNTLDPTGRALYVKMRNAYREMYEEIIKALGNRIDVTLRDKVDSATTQSEKDRIKEEIAAIKNEIFARLVERGNIDPYFPLTRKGNYWMSYTDIIDGNPDNVVEAFETERARNRKIAELKARGITDTESYSNLNQLRFNRAPATSFVSDVIKTLERNKVSSETTDAVIKLFLDTLPETAFAKSFQARKETPGFQRDAISALQEKLINTSRQLANMEYAVELNAQLKEMEVYSKSVANGVKNPDGTIIPARDNRLINSYIEEYRKRIDFINNPTISRWSQFATSLGFNMLLGLNISSAFVNLAQVPMVTYPYLGGEYGYPEATKAMSEAYRIFTGSGFKKTLEVFGSKGEKTSRKAMPSIDNIDFDKAGLSPELKRLATLVRVAKEQGQIGGSQIYDALEATEKDSISSKVNAVTGFAFHHAERMNRQVTLIAAYNLELAKLNKKGITGAVAEEQAANHAIYVADTTQGGTSAASAPRFAQGAMGRVMFMFKRYGISMMYLQAKTIKAALSNEPPEVKAAARKQLAGIYGMAALFAGAQGVPLFGIAAFIYNLFADDDDDDLETATRKYMGEMLTYGPLSYYTNIDFSGRVSMTDLLIRDMRIGDKPDFVTGILTALGGPIVGVASKMERGLGLMQEGHIERGVEQILPTAIGNMVKATRLYGEGANTLRGDPITGDVNAWNVGAQFFGFSPADYQRQLEINNINKGIDKYVNTQKTSLLRRYYIADRTGDMDARQEVRDELQSLFEKHPALGSLSQVIRDSMESHKRTTKKMVNGVLYSDKMMRELRENADEMDD